MDIDAIIQDEKPDMVIGLDDRYQPIGWNLVQRGDKNVLYIHSDVDSFDDYVNEENWILFESYLLYVGSPNTKKLIELTDSITRSIQIVKRAKFLLQLHEGCEQLKDSLPSHIEKVLKNTPLIKKELKERPVLIYEKNPSPSYKSKDEFEYSWGGSWLEQMVQEHFYNGFKEQIDNKVQDEKLWLEENFYSIGFTSEVRKSKDPINVVLYQIVKEAAELFQKSGKPSWKQVANVFYWLYLSDFTDPMTKKTLREYGFSADLPLSENQDNAIQRHIGIAEKIKKGIKTHLTCYK